MFDFIKKMDEAGSNIQDDVKIIGLSEIIFLFAAFSFVLYMLFPKETLKQKVLKEKKSNDLAIVYIKNIVKFDKRNYELLFHYADIHFRENHFKAVKDIVESLLRSNVPDIKNRAVLLGEKLFKREFFLLKKEEDRNKLLKKYQDMLQDMLLASKDENFQNDILNYFAQSKDKDKYLLALKKLAAKDDEWKIKLAKYFVAHHDLKSALNIYKNMLYDTKGYKDKREILLNTIEVLTYGGFFDQGVKIVRDFEKTFINDDEVFEKIIRFYLAAAKEKSARRYILMRQRKN